jgi:hypothetical protein
MLVVRIVVPLPCQTEYGVARAPLEIVGGHEVAEAALAGRDIQRHRHLAIDAEDGPAVFPSHGHDEGHTAHGAVVLEQVGVPLAVGRVDDAPLRDALVPQDDSAFVRAGDRVGPVDDLRAHVAARPSDVEQVVLPVHLDHLRSFRRQADSPAATRPALGTITRLTPPRLIAETSAVSSTSRMSPTP